MRKKILKVLRNLENKDERRSLDKEAFYIAEKLIDYITSEKRVAGHKNVFNLYHLKNYKEILDNIFKGSDKKWENRRKQLEEEFDFVEYKTKDFPGFEILYLLVGLNYQNAHIQEYRLTYFEKPSIDLKKGIYEDLYKKNENEIGHYYRNLYRIVKLIQTEDFSNDEQKNSLEKSKYRGILRAQLSSYELMMLFYNVMYSTKGEKFKVLLQGTNFFDDHLIEEDFIWKNDKEELRNSGI